MIEKIDLLLRPHNDAEKELIDALEELTGCYGGKNQLMRDCVLRGFMLLKQRIQHLEVDNKTSTLDVLADAMTSSDGRHYGYRLIKTYMDAAAKTKKPSLN